MNKRLLVLGFVASVSIGGVVALTLAQNTAVNPPSQAQAATPSEKTTPISQGAAYQGNVLYVDLKEVNSWWFNPASDKACTTYAHFYDNNSHTYNVTGFVEVENDSGVYAVTVPTLDGVTSWTNVIIIRSDDWPNYKWTNVYNRTAAVSLTGTINGVTVKNYTDSSGYQDNASWSYSAHDRIVNWAKTSGQWFSSGICNSEGSTDTASLASSWSTTATSYGAIVGADVKSYFSNVVATVDYDSLTSGAKIAARYDYIYNKYSSTLGLSDFADRFQD